MLNKRDYDAKLADGTCIHWLFQYSDNAGLSVLVSNFRREFFVSVLNWVVDRVFVVVVVVAHGFVAEFDLESKLPTFSSILKQCRRPNELISYVFSLL